MVGLLSIYSVNIHDSIVRTTILVVRVALWVVWLKCCNVGSCVALWEALLAVSRLLCLIYFQKKL